MRWHSDQVSRWEVLVRALPLAEQVTELSCQVCGPVCGLACGRVCGPACGPVCRRVCGPACGLVCGLVCGLKHIALQTPTEFGVTVAEAATVLALAGLK